MNKIMKLSNYSIYSATSSRPYKAWATMGISTAQEVKIHKKDTSVYKITITHMIDDGMCYNLKRPVTCEVVVKTANITKFIESEIIIPDSETRIINCGGHTSALNSIIKK